MGPLLGPLSFSGRRLVSRGAAPSLIIIKLKLPSVLQRVWNEGTFVYDGNLKDLYSERKVEGNNEGKQIHIHRQREFHCIYL